MRDWFKARNVWGGAFTALTDDEAGRLAKAIWTYTMTGEIKELDGAEKGIFAMILMTLGQDEEHDAVVSKARAIAGARGGIQRQANAMSAQPEEANDSNCLQMPANDSNCSNKNKNKNKSKNKEQDKEKERKQFIPPTVEEVSQYCRDRNNGIDPEYFVAYNENRNWTLSNGKKMKDWRLAVVTWEKHNFSTTPRVVQQKPVAQQYNQRDYADEQEEAMRRMLEGVRA